MCGERFFRFLIFLWFSFFFEGNVGQFSLVNVGESAAYPVSLVLDNV